MTAERRASLSRRAFPTGGVRPWRWRMAAAFVAAVILTAAGQPFPGLLMLAFAAPTAWRYIRRELALGALLAEAYRTERMLRRIPLTDLRLVAQ